MTEKVALVTTVYPAVIPYLSAWRRSVLDQSDSDFDIWIATDDIDPNSIATAFGGELDVTWVPGNAGDTPAQVRTRSLTAVVERYRQVVTIDSDDCLLPDRIERARRALEHADLAGSAMRLINESGESLDLVFGRNCPDADWTNFLVRANLFGLSNSAWRVELLERALPVPADCVLMDWLLATRICHAGGRLVFDEEPGILYRQYRNNTARVVPPYSTTYVAFATERVCAHYSLVLSTPEALSSEISRLYEDEHKRVKRFLHSIVLQPDRLEQYVVSLNAAGVLSAWWSCVAHPEFEEQWTE
ncbi:MAG: glycosyltransferase family 2 protein [Proteobacteria bacterium]|nr:glycosyltransferase family 2 protein [Pseudomonadota bacterium]